MITRVIILATALIAARDLLAEPAFALARPAGPLAVVYPDTKSATLFYYPPGALRVGDDPQGGPDLRFLQMIYTGTEAMRDSGQFVARSVLSFRVIMDPPLPADIRAARAVLPAGSRLVPVPIRRIESRLVWVPVAADTASEPQAPESQLGGARSEDSDRAAPSSSSSYWTERVFTLNPDSLSSQALWEALHKGQVILSVAYALFSEGDTQGVTEFSGTVTPALAELLKRTGDHVEQFPVRADAFAIVADTKRFHDRFIRIDINQNIPQGYAALDIRCYDFDNALRPDLARKNVDVRAMGVNGRVVTRSVIFRASTPEVASAGLKFPVAVRLDQPFTFRTIEIAKDGKQKVGAWIQRDKWHELLDVTTSAEDRPVKPDQEEDMK